MVVPESVRAYPISALLQRMLSGLRIPFAHGTAASSST
jgi:hypothetical protein